MSLKKIWEEIKYLFKEDEQDIFKLVRKINAKLEEKRAERLANWKKTFC